MTKNRGCSLICKTCAISLIAMLCGGTTVVAQRAGHLKGERRTLADAAKALDFSLHAVGRIAPMMLSTKR